MKTTYDFQIYFCGITTSVEIQSVQIFVKSQQIDPPPSATRIGRYNFLDVRKNPKNPLWDLTFKNMKKSCLRVGLKVTQNLIMWGGSPSLAGI